MQTNQWTPTTETPARRISQRQATPLAKPHTAALLAAVTLWVALTAPVARGEKSPYDWALIRLDYARQEKFEQLERLCDRMHNLASEAAQDKRVLAFYHMNYNYENAVAQGGVPDTVREDVERFRRDFNGYYVHNYFSFYDFLFIDLDGRVFFTLRKESDVHQDLLEQGNADSPLGRCIAAKPTDERFVDYHNYGPSAEPAAFFVEPVSKDGEQVGWLALQCAINRVNALFSATQDLGETGETFLVNREGYMLTDSFLEGRSSILRRHLADENIQAKFQAGQGHRTVTDYRGATALSSFEVFPFMGARWLVVAKIDRNEVTTQHYARHRRYYADRILEHLTEETLPARRHPEPMDDDRPVLRVDMDEFLKVDDGQRLETWGIATCTGLLVAYPDRFAYLAHISPRDRVYGEDGTDLLGQMTKNINRFAIRPYEKHEVVFTIVAPHLKGVVPTIDAIVDRGFLLSQIRVLHNSEAKTAALVYDYTTDRLDVTWRDQDGRRDEGVHQGEDATNIGRLLEHLMDHKAED